MSSPTSAVLSINLRNPDEHDAARGHLRILVEQGKMNEATVLERVLEVGCISHEGARKYLMRVYTDLTPHTAETAVDAVSQFLTTL